jgi:hypothetical protein
VHPTGTNASNQNGPVERAHQTTSNVLRATHLGAGFDAKFWPYVMNWRVAGSRGLKVVLGGFACRAEEGEKTRWLVDNYGSKDHCVEFDHYIFRKGDRLETEPLTAVLGTVRARP